MPGILSFLGTNNNSSNFLSKKVTFFGCILIKTLNFNKFFYGMNNFSKAEKYSRITMCDHLPNLTTTAVSIQSEPLVNVTTSSSKLFGRISVVFTSCKTPRRLKVTDLYVCIVVHYSESASDNIKTTHIVKKCCMQRILFSHSLPFSVKTPCDSFCDQLL